ncbi:hypothetical protein Sjap_024616 [Stephania japonica]|uniref:PROP1-like PPR domain-containing protein n=1 Tax=Stephania japonica TaxID=461633 RepID=A0AAP0HLN6_9MAGN
MAALLRNPRLPSSQTLLRLFSSSSKTLETPPNPTHRSLKSQLRSEFDPENLVKLFQQSANTPRFQRDRSVFDICVTKLSRSQRFDLIEQILENQKKDLVGLKTEGFWIRLMMLYSQSRMLDQAIRVFDQMEELGCKRTEKSLSALLSVCLENRRFDLVHEYAELAPKKIGVEPGIVHYNLVVRAFCKKSKVEKARALIEKLENENNVKPDITSYNLMLGAYVRNGDDAKFDEIMELINDKELKQNVSTYNHRIVKLCKGKECNRAKKLVDVMASKGIEPNRATYNILIEGYCKMADFGSAKKVMEKMKKGELVKPNPDTYFTFVRYYVEEKEFDSALEMCKESFEKKWIPPFETMMKLVNGLVSVSEEDKAKEIVEEMKKRLKGSAAESWAKIEADLSLSQ